MPGTLAGSVQVQWGLGSGVSHVEEAVLGGYSCVATRCVLTSRFSCAVYAPPTFLPPVQALANVTETDVRTPLHIAPLLLVNLLSSYCYPHAMVHLVLQAPSSAALYNASSCSYTAAVLVDCGLTNEVATTLVLTDSVKEAAMGLGRQWTAPTIPPGNVLLASSTALAFGLAVGDVIMVSVNIPFTLRHALAPSPPQVKARASLSPLSCSHSRSLLSFSNTPSLFYSPTTLSLLSHTLSLCFTFTRAFFLSRVPFFLYTRQVFASVPTHSRRVANRTGRPSQRGVA